MENQALIDKVKKLLELAGSPNENEAKLAYERAQALIAKYSLDLSGENKPEAIVQVDYVCSYRSGGLSEVLPFMAQALGKPFGTYVLIRPWKGNQVVLVGFATNVKVTAYAIDSVLAQLMQDFRREFKKYRTVAFSTNFWNGALQAIQKRFEEAGDKAETGLVVYDPVRAFMASFTGSAKLSAGSADTQAGLSAGAAAGNAVSIRQGVEAPSFRGKLLS